MHRNGLNVNTRLFGLLSKFLHCYRVDHGDPGPYFGRGSNRVGSPVKVVTELPFKEQLVVHRPPIFVHPHKSTCCND